MLNEGNVEPYLPQEWTEQEASVLAHLVGMYGPTNWGIISAGVATKTETQVRGGRWMGIMLGWPPRPRPRKGGTMDGNYGAKYVGA